MQLSLAFFPRSPKMTSHWGYLEGSGAGQERGEGVQRRERVGSRHRVPQSLGGDGHGGEDPKGIGTRGRTAAEWPIRIADAAGLCAHCLKQKLIIQGLFLAPVEFLIAHVLHLYSCCCEKSYPIPEKSHFPPILCSILCNEETWPLKEKQQINSELSLHTDHAWIPSMCKCILRNEVANLNVLDFKFSLSIHLSQP